MAAASPHRRRGRLAFQARLTTAKGAVFATTPKQARRGDPGAPPIAISLDKDGLVFERLESKQGAKDGQRLAAPAPAEGWHALDLAWKGGKATLKLDDKPIGTIDIQGLNIGRGTGVAVAEFARFLFGGRGDAVTAIDEVRCYRPF